MLATVVDGGALLQVLWVSFSAGIGLTLMFSLSIAGAARASQYRRAGEVRSAAVWSAITVVCVAICALVVVLGVIVMLHK
jgi:ABC-type nickel/cobalt efflux system permease component RcnA